MGILDISDRPVSGDGLRAAGAPQGSAPVIAIPPATLAPNSEAQEFLYTASINLALGGSAFVALTDTDTGAAFARQIPVEYRAVISDILVYCPDMVAGVAAYLFFRILINGAPTSAWSNVPIFPRQGVASLSFSPQKFEVQPGAIISVLGENTDVGNTHFLACYLQGWQWPK